MFSIMELDLTTDENEPMAMAGAGLSGPRLAVSPSEMQKRRSNMATLLMNGISDEEIAKVMEAEHGMTEQESEVLKMQVAERLLSESEQRKPYKKSLAEKRLHGHIAKASKRGAWGAVANLEGQLARIQGTEEPVESRVTIDARVQTATMHILAGMSPAQVDELIAEEIARERLLPK